MLEGVIARKVDAYPGVRLSELAAAYLGLGRQQDALTAANNALKECGAPDDLACIRALDQRAAVHAALGDRDAALDDLRKAMQLVETKRSRLVPEDFFKQQFNLAQRELYTRAIALQTRAGQNAEALETAELARSRAFVDLLATRDLTLPLSTASNAAGVANQTTSLDGPPLVFRGARDPGSVPAATPDRLSSHASVPAASADDLATTARRLRSTLLAYWVGRDEVFVWVVSPEGDVRASQVAVRTARLQDLVRATTTPGSDPATGRVWRDLYDLLIKPVRADLPRTSGALLTVLPHGPIASVPFAGLQSERGRYLIEDYTLHYAPGGAVLQFTAARKRATARSGRVLLVSDPVPPTLSSLDPPLPRLPGARAESQAISSLVPRQRVTLLEDTAASEPAVREAAPGKSVLHFATHAVVRDSDPFSSFLAVGRTGVDDGLLTAREIYGLRLDADLVVLSACRSGSGRVIGDGIATFARAFIYAGAPSIVASLWDVADEPTNRLLPQFYRAWLGGATKASALRTAQLRLLSELRAGKVRIDTPAGLVTLPDHPVFWAGFALIGEPD
jgi:CHAT domain-containing protein